MATGVCRNFREAGFSHEIGSTHDWILGAFAELVDHTVADIQNGATIIDIDVVPNPRDSESGPMLVIRDDGSGLNAASMHDCLGLQLKHGYSQIRFKTSSMRIGADTLVLGRSREISTLTVGFLSFSYLYHSGAIDVHNPIIEFTLLADGTVQRLPRTTDADWIRDLNHVLTWSPFSSESELLEQFANIESHGTKVIISNFWLDEGLAELDFMSDPFDIKVREVPCEVDSDTANHLSRSLTNRYLISLRGYLSILYLCMPESFQMTLRGAVIKHHKIVSSLQYCGEVDYSPVKSSASCPGPALQETVVTQIGFTKEFPDMQGSGQGFNVYHKNRLVLPFWNVTKDVKGQGVVGVLEVNYLEPQPNRQEFKPSVLFQRLEKQLKSMAETFWEVNHHLVEPKVSLRPLVSADQVRFGADQVRFGADQVGVGADQVGFGADHMGSGSGWSGKHLPSNPREMQTDETAALKTRLEEVERKCLDMETERQDMKTARQEDKRKYEHLIRDVKSRDYEVKQLKLQMKELKRKFGIPDD